MKNALHVIVEVVFYGLAFVGALWVLFRWV